MKTLITFGLGIAIGFRFKKMERAKEPKLIIADDRDSLGEYLFGDDAKEVFRKYLKAHQPSQ